MGGGVGQAHLVVLARHLHQHRARAAQQAHAHRLVVHEGARAAVARHHAAQHQLLLGLHPLLAQHGVHGVVWRRGEAGDHGGLGRALAHEPRLRAHAQRQAQAVEQDGLAGAGLAGEHGQALAELQVEALDQHHVADRECGQHGRRMGGGAAMSSPDVARDVMPANPVRAGPRVLEDPAEGAVEEARAAGVGVGLADLAPGDEAVAH